MCTGGINLIPRIKHVEPMKNYLLKVSFDDGMKCIYDVNEDINTIKIFEDLKKVQGLFEQVKLDTSRTCVYWNDMIDLPSDAIYEYGKAIEE